MNQGLTPQQQLLLEDLLQEYSGIAQSDLENLVKLGYAEQSIHDILQILFNQVWRLNTHAGLHSKDFGNITPEEYQKLAIKFMSGAPGPNVFQLVRPNGEYVRWNSVTGEFGSLFKNGSLKTYFIKKASQRGYVYFLKQALQTN